MLELFRECSNNVVITIKVIVFPLEGEKYPLPSISSNDCSNSLQVQHNLSFMCDLTPNHFLFVFLSDVPSTRFSIVFLQLWQIIIPWSSLCLLGSTRGHCVALLHPYHCNTISWFWQALYSEYEHRGTKVKQPSHNSLITLWRETKLSLRASVPSDCSTGPLVGCGFSTQPPRNHWVH